MAQRTRVAPEGAHPLTLYAAFLQDLLNSRESVAFLGVLCRFPPVFFHIALEYGFNAQAMDCQGSFECFELSPGRFIPWRRLCTIGCNVVRRSVAIGPPVLHADQNETNDGALALHRTSWPICTAWRHLACIGVHKGRIHGGYRD